MTLQSVRRFAPALVVLGRTVGCHREPAPSHIFYNARIVTVDPQFRTVEAMAIRDRHIVAVGKKTDIVKLAASGTEQIDLGGKTVSPGLIDSRVHAAAASMYEFEHPVPDMKSVEDALAYIKTRAETSDGNAAASSNSRNKSSGARLPYTTRWDPACLNRFITDAWL